MLQPLSPICLYCFKPASPRKELQNMVGYHLDPEDKPFDTPAKWSSDAESEEMEEHFPLWNSSQYLTDEELLGNSPEVPYHHALHLKDTAQQLLTLHQIILAMTKRLLSGSSRECGTAMFLPSRGLPCSTKEYKNALKGPCFWIAFPPSNWERWCLKQLLIEDWIMSHHS